MHPIIARVIDVEAAAADARVHEVGYSNSGTEVDAYLADVGLGPGYAWCAAFQCYCLHKAGGDIGFRSASCPEIEAWARGKGILHQAGPRVGDWCLLQEHDAAGRYSGHIGLVTAVHGSTMETIEGNTSSGDGGSQTDGGGVYRRTRAIAGWWFVRWVDALRAPRALRVQLVDLAGNRRVIGCRALLEDGRLRADVRAIAEGLGAYVDTHLAVGGLYSLHQGQRHLTLHVGSSDGHPAIENGRLRADVRYVAEGLGCHLDTTAFASGLVTLKRASP